MIERKLKARLEQHWHSGKVLIVLVYDRMMNDEL
jgi:hypothetical protein